MNQALSNHHPRRHHPPSNHNDNRDIHDCKHMAHVHKAVTLATHHMLHCLP